MKNKFDILFEQIMNENSLFDVKEKIKSINNLNDSEKTPENSAELPVEGQDKVVEEFNKRLEAVKTAISYPWLKEPYEGIYNELSKYNKKIFLYKNDKQLLTQINYTIFQVLGPDPSNKYVLKRKENKVSFSIWKECLKKIDEIVLAVKEYPYFKLSYLAICLNTLFNKTVSTSYINWFESCIENAKKLLSAINEKPVWFDLDEYIKKLDELKNKKDTDENWVNTVEITDEIRDNYFIDYGYMNSWQQDDNDKYHTAYILHNRDKKEHPELHDGPHLRKNGRSDETTYCSCGFSHSVDSSD
jgi:hypothetical protein